VCGDLGCRALSADVVVTATTVEWRELGWQVDYEPFDATDVIEPARGFIFDRNEYEAVLIPLRERYAYLAATVSSVAKPTSHRRWWHPGWHERGRGSR
jgi:hypothetical protein